MFFKEKLLNDKPKVPIKPPAPYPPCNSTWLDPFSTKVQSKSTVPAAGSIFTGSGRMASASKKPNCPNSLTERITKSLFHFSPGRVLNSL